MFNLNAPASNLRIIRINLRIMRKLISDALFSKTRQKILASTLLRPDKWWYLSDLAKHLHLTPSTLQNELRSLTSAEILESKKEGNRVYYKANLLCPVFLELQAILVKTSGITDVLKKIIIKFDKQIQLAFIYGSMARSEAVSSSDVDLMIIGEIKLSELTDGLNRIEMQLAREVNVSIFSEKEFIREYKKNNSFIKTVMKNEKIFLKGENDELKVILG